MKVIYSIMIEMKLKLKRYYDITKHLYIYNNNIILNPKWKLALFHQDNWKKKAIDKYHDQCYRVYMKNYYNYDIQSTHTSSIEMKYSWESIDKKENNNEK